MARQPFTVRPLGWPESAGWGQRDAQWIELQSTAVGRVMINGHDVVRSFVVVQHAVRAISGLGLLAGRLPAYGQASFGTGVLDAAAGIQQPNDVDLLITAGPVWLGLSTPTRRTSFLVSANLGCCSRCGLLWDLDA